MSVGVGLLGAAGIARKTWNAIHCAGLRVVAVGCRDASRGNAFIDECMSILHIPPSGRPDAVGYEELIGNPDVRVVYVPLPVLCRDRWIRACAAAGKHVVCEKPPAGNAQQLLEWVELFKAKNLMFMDGTMLSHGKRLLELKQALHERNEIGTIRHIHQEFCFTADPSDIRMDPGLEPMGALGDLGWYAVRYAQHLLGADPAVKHASSQRSSNGAIVSLFALLEYPHGATQSFRVSLAATCVQQMSITGTTGCISMDDFVLPCVGDATTYVLHRNVITSERCGVPHVRATEVRSVDEKSTYQEEQLWRDVATLAQPGGTGFDASWAQLAVDTQRTLDAIYAAC